MITIKEPFGYSFGVAKYDPQLGNAIKNWHNTSMIKQFNGYVHINRMAINYFCELLRKQNISYCLMTEIEKNGYVYETYYENHVIRTSHSYSLSHQTNK